MIRLFSLFLICCLTGLYPADYEPLFDSMLIQRNGSVEGGAPRIAMVTVIISGNDQDKIEQVNNLNYAKVVSFGTRSKELYARKHGYDFIMATEKINDCYGLPAQRELECAWTKLAAVSRLLEHYDWVFWTDADSIILNFDIRLEDFIDEQYDIIACIEDIGFRHPGPYRNISFINTGQVFYKNCDYAKTLIRESWINHVENTPGRYEQMRINHYIKSSGTGDHVLVYNGVAFNLAPQHYQPGHFLVHMYAHHGKKLYRVFKEFERKYGWILDHQEALLQESPYSSLLE